MPNRLRISLVIPVYNEESHLAACLQSVMSQHQAFYEVIVVDNNSADNSAAIAAQFAGVKVIKEPRQGVVHARGRGFDAATGDIIARIDADTILDSNWTRTVRRIFQDPAVDAVSGSITYHDIPRQDFFGALELFFRQRIADKMGDEVFLYGANMALRRSTWQQVRGEVCQARGMHEDFDLAIHIEELGGSVIFDKHLHSAVSLRRFDTNIRDFWSYVLLSPKTYALHGRKSQRHMYPVIVLVLMAYGVIKLLYRGYDPAEECFSLHKLFSPTPSMRVNPATFVD